MVFFFFFFPSRRRHTRFKCDWSSDVCSSDLTLFHHAVVIGGGLLGLEAANGLMKQGMKVTVVHLPDVLMERQLDQAAARMLRKELEARGLRFIFKGVTQEIIGKARVQGVRLEDGQET